jgi:hypothetical protein
MQTVSNIKFSTINDLIKTTTYVAQNPLMAFNLYRPYKSPSGGATYATLLKLLSQKFLLNPIISVALEAKFSTSKEFHTLFRLMMTKSVHSIL